ncbi:MAG TPA: EpsI family protein [Methylomirabilota bacterium]|nr:EpsI family protein [Methylomirabilota bacterium]
MSAGLLLGALLVLQLGSAGEAVPIRKELDRFPALVGAWRGQEASVLDAEVLNILRVKDYVLRRYADANGRSVWLYVGYWDTQRKGAQIHSPKNCLPGSGWEPLEASELTVPLAGGRPAITVNRYLVQKDRDQQLVLYWYQSEGRAIAGEVAARLDLVRRAALRSRTDGALIRVSSPVYGSVHETSDRLVEYVRAMYPLLDDYLPS